MTYYGNFDMRKAEAKGKTGHDIRTDGGNSLRPQICVGSVAPGNLYALS